MINHCLKWFFSTEIIKRHQVGSELVRQHLRHIQKKYFKFPKRTEHFKYVKEDVEEYFFQFHCNQQKLNFEQKLEILETVVRLKPKFIWNDILGVQNVIKSLSRDLSTIQYEDDIEINVSQYINLLHSIQYYDQSTWISAIDNYHKQGNLNWIQYKEFTDSIFYFSKCVNEEWQRNIIKDICQEAFSDFVGFVENSVRLEIDAEELFKTYSNIRKFDLYATTNNIRSIIQYYGYHIEKKKNNQDYQIPQAVYLFLLSMIFDHVKQKELQFQLEKLFKYLMEHIYEDYNKFLDYDKLITDHQTYISMLKLASDNYYHQLLEEPVQLAWSQGKFSLLTQKKLHSDFYTSLENVLVVKLYCQNLTQSFFNSEQVELIVSLLDKQALENITKLQVQQQNLHALINFYKTLAEDEHQKEYLKVLGQSQLSLSDVIFTETELIECLKELDGTDMIYYLNNLLDSILAYVGDNINLFKSEDWCFTYYIVYKYRVKGLEEDTTTKLQENLDVLKRYIRLQYATNLRRAIPVNSHFYKILSVVDIETFYADDVANY